MFCFIFLSFIIFFFPSLTARMLGATQQFSDPDALKVQTVFENFLEEFSPTGYVSENGESYYRNRVRLMVENGEDIFVVSFRHIFSYDKSLAEVIRIQYYRFTLAMLTALKNVLAKINVEYLFTANDIPREFQISIAHFPNVSHVHQLRSNMIGSLVKVCGTVTRIHDRRPELVEGVFRCMLPKCGHKTGRIPQAYGYSTPSCCPNPRCPNRTDFELIVDESVFGDVQRVRLQGNEVGATSSPPLLDVVLRGRMVNCLKPGDRALITGVLCSVPSVIKKVKSNIYGPGGTSSVLNEMAFHTILCANFVQIQENIDSDKIRKENSDIFKDEQDDESIIENSNAITNHTNDNNPDHGDDVTTAGTNMSITEEIIENRNLNTSSGNNTQDNNSEESLSLPPPYPDISAVLDDSTEYVVASFSEQEKVVLRKMLNDENLYPNLVASFAPFLCGMDYVKKGVLLMLVGGVSKHNKEGIKLRGDINVLLVGDPATGKSQLLRYVSSFHHRGIYTSGKSASAAGLTASVVKDGSSSSGSFTVEAGALVLADRGVCCIDEFDKMSANDRSAIHESMEQQTVSISKAGIQCTLNSRCSVLASMNPIGGWYDTTRSVYGNVDLSLALLSRFDLVFVVTGSENTLQMDRQIGARILENNTIDAFGNNASIPAHLLDNESENNNEENMGNDGNDAINNNSFEMEGIDDIERIPKPPYSQKDLYNYIRFVRTLRPTITSEAQHAIAVQYAKMRSVNGNNTVRQLESIIRLSEAFAKLFGHNYVREIHVEEARRVMMGEDSGITSGLNNTEIGGGFITLVDRSADGNDSDDDNGLGSDDETSATETQTGADEDIYAMDGENNNNNNNKKRRRGRHNKRTPVTTYKIPAKLYWKYAKIAIVYIRNTIANNQANSTDNDNTGSDRTRRVVGVRQKDVVEYIYKCVTDADKEGGASSARAEDDVSDGDLKRIIDLVINRLIVTDSVLKVADGSVPTASDDERLLDVHPNYSS